MMPNFECGAMLDQMKVRKSLVMGPRVGQYRMGWKMISLRSLVSSPHCMVEDTHEQPQAYFCHRLSSSPHVSETPSSNPPCA